MPYIARKQGDKYAVYKKDTGKLVGRTDGNKEALRKYLAALHINAESIKLENMKPNKTIKLASLINLKESEQHPVDGMSTEQKKAFLEAVYRFAEHSNDIYRAHSLRETSKHLSTLIEAAHQLTLSETEDWFDANTVNRHMKHLDEAHKIFEKTASEMSVLQQRLESAYEDIGSTLSKYYDINGMVNEASAEAGAGADYQKFFQKAMKKFKIQEPGDLEDDKSKKKFFNWIDTNYTAKTEPTKDKGEKESEKEEVKEGKYAFGNPALDGAARKRVWNMIMKRSNNMKKLKKIAELADLVAGTKTSITDIDDVHELVDDLTGAQFEKFYNETLANAMAQKLI
jgi:hypothetical protein